MEANSPGNAGIVVVDTSDFTWKAYGGYLAASTGGGHDHRSVKPAAGRQVRGRHHHYSDDGSFTNLIDLLADAMHWCDCDRSRISTTHSA